MLASSRIARYLIAGSAGQSLTEQPLSRPHRISLNAIKVERQQELLHFGVPARRLPQKVVESVETRMAGGC